MPILESIDVHKLIGYGSLVEHNLGTTLDVNSNTDTRILVPKCGNKFIIIASLF